MLLPVTVAVERAPEERQSPRRVAESRMHAARVVTLPSVSGCSAEHALAAVERALVERQSPGRVAQSLHA